jgi:uncharacterized MAPEG superfamily protein
LHRQQEHASETRIRILRPHNLKTTAIMPINFPLLSIPIYYALAMWPHARAISIATKGDLTKHDNRNPKSTTLIEKHKQRLSPEDFAAYERGESCHRNALENMPLFLAAIFAGLLAERDAGRDLGTSFFAASWLIVRTLYSINYVNTTSIKWSFARSGLWFVGTLLCFGMIGRAALQLA